MVVWWWGIQVSFFSCPFSLLSIHSIQLDVRDKTNPFKQNTMVDSDTNDLRPEKFAKKVRTSLPSSGQKKSSDFLVSNSVRTEQNDTTRNTNPR